MPHRHEDGTTGHRLRGQQRGHLVKYWPLRETGFMELEWRERDGARCGVMKEGGKYEGEEDVTAVKMQLCWYTASVVDMQQFKAAIRLWFQTTTTTGLDLILERKNNIVETALKVIYDRCEWAFRYMNSHLSFLRRPNYMSQLFLLICIQRNSRRSIQYDT